MKNTSAAFHISASALSGLPEGSSPEIVFAGRSNVGKSTLLNSLTESKGLAKTSSTPGKTRLINYFLINNQFYFVDLPGYGYAKVGKKERGKFSAFVSDYLHNRPNLRGTFVLIDSRLSPQGLDLEFLNWMVGCGLPFILAFTKTDALSKGAAQKNIETFLASMREITEEEPTYVLSSSKDQQGRKEILALIAEALSESPA